MRGRRGGTAMSDYRRIDPPDLHNQARALAGLADELETSARRVNGALAAVGRAAHTAPLADSAAWMSTWSNTMNSKAAIAAEATSMPLAPPSIQGHAAGTPPAARARLRAVRVPRWVERPMLGVQQLTRSVTRAVAQTALVREVRTVAERVLERVPVWQMVTRYRAVQQAVTTWHTVYERRFVPQQVTVYETHFRQLAQYVTALVPVYRTVTHFFWNGWQFVTHVVPIVSYQAVSRVQYVAIPVRVARTVTRWVEQWVARAAPVTAWRTVLEPYQVAVRSWVDRWVTRNIQRVVMVPRKTIHLATTAVTDRLSATALRGTWIWEERSTVELQPQAMSGTSPAMKTPDDTGGTTPNTTHGSPPPVRRPTGGELARLSEIGATAHEVTAYQTAVGDELARARRAGTSAGGSAGLAGLLGGVGAVALAGYQRAQEGSLGFFTGENPIDSVRRALAGISGDRRYSPADLGFARLAEPGTAEQRVLSGIGKELVDPLSLATVGGGIGLRAFTVGAIAAGNVAEEVAAALGANKTEQELTHLAVAGAGGLAAAASALRGVAQQATRAVEAAHAIRVRSALGRAKARAAARLGELFSDPIAAAAALRTAPPASDEARQLADLLAREATHLNGSAKRVVLGKADEGGGYIAEARTNGGIWFEAPEGFYDAAGPEASWATNEAFLRQQIDHGIGRVEFRGLDIKADVNGYKGDPRPPAPSRIKESLFLSELAPRRRYIAEGSGDFRLIDTIAGDARREIAGTGVTGTAGETARQATEFANGAERDADRTTLRREHETRTDE